MSDLRRAALYCRLVGSTESAHDQLGILQRTAALRGWSIVATATDQASRHTSVRPDRPGLTALLQAAAARRDFPVLLIPSLSHLASTLPQLISVVNELHGHGIDLCSGRDEIDTTTPAGKAAFTAFAALAAFEHEQASQRAKISLDHARRNGTRLGRPSNMNAGVRAAIIALHQRGLSIRGIARQLRVGNATVCKVLQAATNPPSSQVGRNPETVLGRPWDRHRTPGTVPRSDPAGIPPAS